MKKHPHVPAILYDPEIILTMFFPLKLQNDNSSNVILPC